MDIAHLQRFAQWGLQAEILVLDSVVPGGVLVEGARFWRRPDLPLHLAGNGLRRQRTSPGGAWTGDQPAHHLVVHDADSTLPDTSWVELRGEKPRFTPVHSRGGGELGTTASPWNAEAAAAATNCTPPAASRWPWMT